MNGEIFQYGTNIPSDFSKDVVIELSDIMGIEFEKNKFEVAFKYNGELDDIECVCVFRDAGNKERFIICACGCDFDKIIVRCTKKEHNNIKKYLYYITNKTWRDAGHSDQLSEEDFYNNYNTEWDDYKRALEYYKVDYI